MSTPSPSGARLLGHPLHPALVHLPVGLFLGAAVWDCLGLALAEPSWWWLARACLGLGLVGLVPAAATGLVDFLGLPAAQPAEKVATRHMLWAMSAGGLFVASLLLHRGARTPTPAHPGWATAATLVGCAVLAVAGALGGELVYRHGVGVHRRGAQPAEGAPPP
ncbi:MAG: DUF2231 domain-containing protein [Thermoanaerobaculia bacterium]